MRPSILDRKAFSWKSISETVFHVKIILLVTFIATAQMFLVSGVVKAEAMIEIRAIGSSPVREGNLAEAKKDALDQALQKAVIEAVEQTLSPAEVTKNLKKLTESVFQTGRSLVQDYQVEAEAYSQTLFVVIVKASIVHESLAEELRNAGFTMLGMGGKRIVVIFSGEEWIKPILMEEMEKTLASLGLATKVEGADLYDLSALSVYTWADIGRQKQADFIAWCHFQHACSENPDGDVPCRGQISTKIVDVDNRLLAASRVLNSEGSYKDVQEGKAGVARNLSEQMNRFMQDSLTGYNLRENLPETSLMVVLEGVTLYAQYEQVRGVLKNTIPGVEQVSLDSAGGGRFDIKVRYRGREEELKTKLLDHPFSRFQLLPEEPRAGAVIFRVQIKKDREADADRTTP